MPDDLASRVEALEIRIAYQEAVIDDLNAAITGQWATIEALQRRLAALDERVQDAEARASAGAPSVRPPHY